MSSPLPISWSTITHAADGWIRRAGSRWLLGLLVASMVSLGFAERSFDRIQAVAQQRYGAAGVGVVQSWRKLLADARGLSELEKLQRVNAYFNQRVLFNDDWKIWGQSDYWATPLETLARGSGDCEDFSIAKFFSLRALGIAPEKLRMIYVRAQLGAPGSGNAQAHMVLGYFATPRAVPLVLDNLIGAVLPASQRPDLSPVFSFNDTGLWAGGRRAAAEPTARLSHWRDLLSRLANEGFL